MGSLGGGDTPIMHVKIDMCVAIVVKKSIKIDRWWSVVLKTPGKVDGGGDLVAQRCWAAQVGGGDQIGCMHAQKIEIVDKV